MTPSTLRVGATSLSLLLLLLFLLQPSEKITNNTASQTQRSPQNGGDAYETA